MNIRRIGGVFVVIVIVVLIIYFSVTGSSKSETTAAATGAAGAAGAAAAPPAYIKITGVDYPGNDIKHVQDLTLEQCKAECDKDDTCALAAMSTDGTHCWLKSAAKTMYINADQVNYFKPGRAYDPIGTYDLVRPASHCGGSHTFTSPAWALLKPGEAKTLADNSMSGDTLYNDYINRGLKKCDEDVACKYVSVWRDAGYRTYKDGQCNTYTASDNASVFKKK